MTERFGSFDRLRDIPRASIGTWPTPVRRLEHASNALGTEVWAKIEEDCGAWGGNKVRKREYLIAEARADGIEKLASGGVATSNWAAAAAWHGTRAGFQVQVGLGGYLPDRYRRIYEATTTEVTLLPRLELAPVAAVLARGRAGLGARMWPIGGSGGIGDIGATHAGLEIARAADDGLMPVPSSVFVAVGSCGTVAGIVAGLDIAESSIPVTAVKVSDWPYATPAMIDRRLTNIRKRLGLSGEGAARMTMELRFLGPGYGRPTLESRAAIALARRDGLALDGSYGAKAFAAMCAASRSGPGPFLFVHTSPGEPPAGP